MHPARDEPPGYQLLDVLGRGGMGTVWRARDLRLGREVAIKLLHAPHPTSRQRFAREGQLAASVEHPGVVRIHATGETASGRPYLVCELVEGARTLEQVLPGADLRRRVEWLAEAGEALGAAHAGGVVHRDVKPENLLVGSDGRLRVADFGIATACDLERLTQSGVFTGTPAWLAPEQVNGGRAHDPAVDVWALGGVLYLALTGQPPFAGDTLLELISQINGAALVRPGELAPGVPAALEATCLRALARDPRARHPDGAAFAAELRAWLEGRASAAPSPAPRRRSTVALLAVLLTLAGVGLALLLRPEPSRTPAAPVDPSSPLEGDAALVAQAAACRVEDPRRALTLLARLEPRLRVPEERVPRLLLRLETEPAEAIEGLLDAAEPEARQELQARARLLLQRELQARRVERLRPLLIALRESTLELSASEAVLALLFPTGRELVLVPQTAQAMEELAGGFAALGLARVGEDHLPRDWLPHSEVKRRAESALEVLLRPLPPVRRTAVMLGCLRLDMAVRVEPGQVPGDDPVGGAYRDIHDPDPLRARAALRGAATRLGPVTRAHAWFMLGTPADLEQAMRLEPEDAEILVTAAKASLAAGDVQTGRELLSRLVGRLERPLVGYSNFSRSPVLRESLRILGRVDASAANAFRERFQELGVLHD